MAAAGLQTISAPSCSRIRIRPQIILITDGHPTNALINAGPDVCHSESKEQADVLTAVDVIASVDVHLHCVPVGDANVPFLEKISAQSHGKLFSYKDGRMLAIRTVCTDRAGQVIIYQRQKKDMTKSFGTEQSLVDVKHEATPISIHELSESNLIQAMSGAHVEDRRTTSSTVSPTTVTTGETRSTTPHESNSTTSEVPTTITTSIMPSASTSTEVPINSTITVTRISKVHAPISTSTVAITSNSKAFTTTTSTEADKTDAYSGHRSSASTTSATTRTTAVLPTTSSSIGVSKSSTSDAPITTNVIEHLHDVGSEQQDEEIYVKCDDHNSEGVPVGFDRIKNIFYKKDDVIGHGCNGTVVYRGKFDERDVAVKRLLKEYFSLADQEVKLLRESDQHPHVVRYFWMEEDINFLFIALELCEGTLQDYVEDKLQYIKNIEPIELLHQALSGLAHLHSLGIVHRDLKPHNILISKPNAQGEVRAMISDFGFSKKLPPEQSTFSTRSNVGTEGWIPPEMLKSGQKRTIAVDIFSAGCMMHYVLTKGLHPFGAYAIEIQYNIQQGKFNLDRLPLTSDGVIAKDIIQKMLSDEPRTRPTAKAVLNHLLFWNSTRKLQFIEAASDCISVKTVPKLEEDGSKIVRGDWIKHLSQELQMDIRKDYREKAIRYSGSIVKDLLRVIRNKKHHYNKMSDNIRKSLGSPPDEYLHYFTSRFPLLLLHTYRVMECCAEEDSFKAYYKTE